MGLRKNAVRGPYKGDSAGGILKLTQAFYPALKSAWMKPGRFWCGQYPPSSHVGVKKGGPGPRNHEDMARCIRRGSYFGSTNKGLSPCAVRWRTGGGALWNRAWF